MEDAQERLRAAMENLQGFIGAKPSAKKIKALGAVERAVVDVELEGREALRDRLPPDGSIVRFNGGNHLLRNILTFVDEKGNLMFDAELVKLRANGSPSTAANAQKNVELTLAKAKAAIKAVPESAKRKS